MRYLERTAPLTYLLILIGILAGCAAVAPQPIPNAPSPATSAPPLPAPGAAERWCCSLPPMSVTTPSIVR